MKSSMVNLPVCVFLLIFLPLNYITAQSDVLVELMKQDAAFFDTLLDNPEKYQIQILYTQINRDANNYPHFRTFSYGLNENQYFYPASTIKMPAAFLALEKLNRLSIQGLNRDTPMYTLAGRAPQTAVEKDTSASNGLPSLGHYIKKIFLVSDNDGNYQYREIGYPFFARLGQLIYNHELQRLRPFLPDLNRFKLTYD